MGSGCDQDCRGVRRYQETQDASAVRDVLDDVPTLGYLFTPAATGYSVKYAWKEGRQEHDRMVFLVTPGLKTRSPVLWEEKNPGERPFTVVELHWDGDDAVVKRSLGAPISVENDVLALEDYDAVPAFALVADKTPYYYLDQS